MALIAHDKDALEVLMMMKVVTMMMTMMMTMMFHCFHSFSLETVAKLDCSPSQSSGET